MGVARKPCALLPLIFSPLLVLRRFLVSRSIGKKVVDMAAEDGELRVFVVAGELSGDSIASRLMTSLRKLSPSPVRFAGIGGPLMQREGLSSLFPMEEISVMGIWELLPHLRKLSIRLKQTIESALLFQPHVIVTVDIKGFSFRLLKWLRARRTEKANNAVHVHYVAPSFWAWKGGESRLNELGKFVDHMLCILPFEEEVCRANGIAATYVGHPLLEDMLNMGLNLDTAKSKCHLHGSGDSFRHEHGISPESTVVTLLPGSRIQEVKRMLPMFSQTIQILKESFEDISTIVLVAPNSQVENFVNTETQTWPAPVTLISGLSQSEKHDAFSASRAALCTSGTAVLELLLSGLPCVVAYRAHFVTEWLIKRRTKLNFISLPNILLNSAVVPEVLFDQCRAEHLAFALRGILCGEHGRGSQTAAAAAVVKLLSPPSESTSFGRRTSSIAAFTILYAAERRS